MQQISRQPFSTNLRVKEDLGSEESFVADVDTERLFSDSVLALVHLDPLGRLRVILGELFHDVRTHIRELLLNIQPITEQCYSIHRMQFWVSGYVLWTWTFSWPCSHNDVVPCTQHSQTVMLSAQYMLTLLPVQKVDMKDSNMPSTVISLRMKNGLHCEGNSITCIFTNH